MYKVQNAKPIDAEKKKKLLKLIDEQRGLSKKLIETLNKMEAAVNLAPTK